MMPLLSRSPESSIRECACGHAADDHDGIALRYCAATKTSAIARGCICSPQPTASQR
jgi:hypothetical protein